MAQIETVRGREIDLEDAMSCERCMAVLHDDEAAEGESCPNCGWIFEKVGT